MIVVVGLSHKNAPIAVREKIALPEQDVPEFLRKLVDGGAASEALIVSTCNRVELVAASRNPSDLATVAQSCERALAEHAPSVAGHLYRHEGAAAVRHLFRVAASLDSLVVGEPQILGQVKGAYELAREAGTVGAVLHRTLSRAIRTAKRVRSETAIGSGQVSVPSVAIDLARRIFGDLGGHQALLVGSGEMAETTAKLLATAGTRILVVGRSRDKVDELAARVGGEGRLWSDLRASLVEADMVITSTSAPHFVIDYEAVNGARKSRRGRNQFYIDLAVPRDVDPAIEKLDGVFLFNVDDLSRAVDDTLGARSREADAANRIIELEVDNYDRWAEAEAATPTIVALRQRLALALNHELERSLRGRLKHLGADERAALAKMVEAALNRILHQPTLRLRRAASERSLEGLGFEQLSDVLDELFALELPGDELDEGALAAPPDESEQELSQARKAVNR